MADDQTVSVAPLKCPQCGADIPHGSEGQIICGYCGSTLVLAPNPGGEGGNVRVVNGMRLQGYTLMDSQGTALALLEMLMPVGWQFDGGCQWNLQNPAAPATIAYQVVNPDGAEGFEAFPPINCVDMPGGMGLMGGLMGGQYLGAELAPVMGVHKAMRELVLPHHRGAVDRLEVTDEKPLPGLAEELAAINPGTLGAGETDAGVVRIRYDWQGQAIEEKIMGVVQAVPQQAGGLGGFLGMGGPTPWFIDYLFAIRAREGQLDTLADLFEVMTRSVKLNPVWFAAYKQIQQHLVNGFIRNTQQIGQLSRQISQNADQISDSMYDTWRERQSAMDHVSQSWSEATRGVDSYADPNSDYPVELPGGYEHAWSNALGEYVVTDDHNFDPNLGATVDWTPMQRQ